MAKLGIFTGTTPNDGTGDSLLTGAVKINANFTEIYTAFGDGTNLGIASLTQINASGVITATTFNGNLRATGVSTFATGATVLVGTATSTGTSAQALQVGSASSVQGAYISGNVGIGTTISPYLLSVSSSATPTPGLSGAVIDVTASANGYSQINIRNTSTGNNASSDLILTADTGTDTTNFVDLGVNNSGFSAGTWTINGPTDAYLYTSDTNLTIGVAGVGKSLSFFTGGTLAANERMRVTSVGVGIGSTVPSTKLDLATQRSTAVTNSAAIKTFGTGVAGDVNKITIQPVATTGAISGGIGLAALLEGTGTTNTALVLYTDPGTGSQAEYARITSGGNFLVGSVVSTGTSSQTFQVGSASSIQGAYVSGFVGIGSTNPAYALSVQGDVQISGTLRNSSFVAFSVAFGM